jgi:uncharacterized protein (UPF0216 family)
VYKEGSATAINITGKTSVEIISSILNTEKIYLKNVIIFEHHVTNLP